MTPIEQISDVLKAYRPHFGNPGTDYSAAARWLEAGCDLEKDILTVIRAKIATKKDIYSLGFFTKDILAAKQARENTEQAKARAATPEGQAAKARNIASMIRFGKADPHHVRWLREYEAKHGPVALGQHPEGKCIGAIQSR